MSTSYGTKLVGGAAAVAAASVGLMIVPAPVQAAPADCNGYQFPGGTVSIHQPGIGATTTFDTIAGGTHVDTKAFTDYPEGGDMPGTVIGDINGTSINLKVTREGVSRDYPPLTFKGDVGPDDRGHGTVTWKGGDPGAWDSMGPMKCIPKPAAPEPVDPAPKPQEIAAPAPEQAAAPAPEQAAAPAPEEAAVEAPPPNGPCIPDPFDLNFPGAC
jgi:hypothetical protein